MRLTLAVLHLLALAIGLGAVWVRARTLHQALHPERLRSALTADAWWGVAALVWLATGLWRLFGSLEKPLGYYLHNPLFHAKMGLFVLVFLLELWPMITIMRWRRGAGRATDDIAQRIAIISYVEAGLVIAMVFLASAMARGDGG